MRTICEQYANNMRTICEQYANNMRKICEGLSEGGLEPPRHEANKS